MVWMNMHANNTGDQRVSHAALEITNDGFKRGMNLLLPKSFKPVEGVKYSYP
jgi:hypothetical protein